MSGNANLAVLTLSNTFFDLLNQVNNLTNASNEVINGNLYADGASAWILPNGSLQILSSSGTVLSVSGNANFSQLLTTKTLAITGNATISGNVTNFSNNNVFVSVANTLTAKNIVSNTLLSVANANAVNVNVSSSLWVNVANISLSNTDNAIISTANIAMANVVTANVTTANISNAKIAISNVAIANVTQGIFDTANITTANVDTGVFTTLNVASGNTLAYNISLDTTGSFGIVNGNAVFNDITISGNQTIEGTIVLTANAFQIRTNSASDGFGALEIWRGTAVNANATILFDSGHSVFRVAANDAQSFSTILSTGNLIDSFTNTSVTNAATANAVNAVFSAAISNAAGIVANNGTYVTRRQGIDFVSGKNVTINATANSANTNLTDITIQTNTVMDLSSLSVSGNTAAGNLSVTQNVVTSNLVVSALANVITANVITAYIKQGTISTVNATTANITTVNGTTINANNITISTLANVAVANVQSVYSANVIANVSQANTPLIQYSNTGTITGNTNVNCVLGSFFDLTLASNSNVWFVNAAPNGNNQTIQILIRQSSNGGNGITWQNNVFWSDNLVPVLSTTPNTADMLQFTTFNGGTIWLGAQVYANIPNMNTADTYA